MLSPAAGGAPATVDEGTFDVNAVVTAGVNDTYTIHVVYFAVAALDPYHGVVSLEPIPVITTPTRTATIVTGSKTGISFSHSRPLYAFGAGQDVEPNVRVDYQGNAYVGGIRGLAGGNDLWRFDLNPASPTYDPFLTGRDTGLARRRHVSESGVEGTARCARAEQRKRLGGTAAAIWISRSASSRPCRRRCRRLSRRRVSGRGECFGAAIDRSRRDLTNNPAGNTTVQVDDRHWMEFLGTNTVYLGTASSSA